MKPVISMNELMERWDLSRTAITKMEQDGLLKRLKLPGVRYSMKAVLDLEGIDSKDWSHSPFEWRRLKMSWHVPRKSWNGAGPSSASCRRI